MEEMSGKPNMFYAIVHRNMFNAIVIIKYNDSDGIVQ